MFTTTPERLGSLCSEQIYRYESDVERDITFKIEDVDSGDLLGVKKFYSTATAEINISPIVKQYVLPTTAPYEDGFFTIKRQGYARIGLIECENGDKSDSQTMLLSEDNRGYAIISTIPVEAPIENHEGEVALISAFAPQSRAMSIGESDTLLFTAPAGSDVRMVVEQYAYEIEDPVAVKSYTMTIEEPGFAAFNVVARPYMDQLKHILEPQIETLHLRFQVAQEVSVENENGTFVTEVVYCDCVTIDYQIIDQPLDGTRIAWVSHKGTIEHYTFPAIKARTIDENRVTKMTLCSAFETTRIREVLAQIVKSPRLWVVTTSIDAPTPEDMMIEGAVTQTYTRAELLSKSLASTPATSLATMEIEIAYNA
ncbi:MAG: hypothetical protein SNH79_03515 [Rikenellaceae bacterium]